MTNELKIAIKQALNKYLSDKNLSQNEFARQNNINVSYISSIRNGKNTVGDSKIADKYFKLIAQAIGMSTSTVWKMVETRQYIEILNAFEEARKKGINRTIIGGTGYGKSEITKLYKQNKPEHTYIITVGKHFRPKDFIEQLSIAMNSKYTSGSSHRTLISIVNKIKNLYLIGAEPLIIVDECENVNVNVLGYIKVLFDYLESVCPIALIGTDQLTDNIEKWSLRNKQGVPQFWRRFKIGVRYLPEITNKDLISMMNSQEVNDKPLQRFLIDNNYNNYGLLHDALVYAKREAERLNVELDLNLFKTVHNLTHNKLIA